jgi:DNA ligase-1
MNKSFKPMLASPAVLDDLTFPRFGSPKIDGIRASNVDGRLLSRTLKEIPNRHVYNMFNQNKFKWLDGELIAGSPTSETCYRDTVSVVMSDDKPALDVTWYVFDYWLEPTLPYSARLHLLAAKVKELNHPHIKMLAHEPLNDRAALDLYEAEQVEQGYEGVMLNDPAAAYKFGRATPKGGELLKVKRFIDSEATVIGVEEEMFNGNDAQTNELGRTKRSTAKAGLIGKGTMGALIVRDVKTKVEFNIGTGFTAQDRIEWWGWFKTQTAKTTPPVIKYKSFPVGVKDKPRHPVYLGLRPSGA